MNDFAPAKRVVSSDRPELSPAVFGRLIGRSKVMRDVITRLRAVASHEATLLLEGPSGTGKEVAAEAVHAASPRRNKPFVVVDCASIARSLIEAELFGHERGAYTGATHARPGAFVRAHGGTVFLDEIGELDLELQPRLLRLIERREVKPLGSSTPRRVDVRIIAATNRDLAREAARGTFRSDLYYRLAVTCVRMPALAERAEDVPLLCDHLINELAERGLNQPLDMSQLAMLAERSWPGNVRELKNAVERLATLGADSFDPAWEQRNVTTIESTRLSFHEAKARVLSTFERQYLTEILDQHAGNITAAAQAAQVDRVHFLRLLDKYGLRKVR
jgi:two-component system nitrogen regulation response regulator GlnG